MTHQITLRATQDAYVDKNTTGRNFGNDPKLSVNGNGSNTQFAYLAFSLKALRKRDNIVKSATLQLHLRGTGWDPGDDVTARRITQKWGERSIKWSATPDTTATDAVTESIVDDTAGAVFEIDVTDMVATAVAGSSWHGIRLARTQSGDAYFHSSEQSNHNFRPKLIVTYSIRPAAPTNLRPRGGNAVDASKPKLAWDCEEMSALWVQANATDDFSSPSYDSGWQLSETPYWDLNLATSPTFTAIADGATRYWRVKIKNEDGDASEYSDSVHFERHIYGVFDITSPASDGDAVDSTTPTVITSLTGNTQTKLEWDVYKEDPDEPGSWLFMTNDQQVGTDPSFEVDTASIDDEDANYKVTVKNWDEYDRSTGVGESSYLIDERQFVYDPAAGTTVVSALTATQNPTGSPIVTLSWTRASAPDSYTIFMNGKTRDNWQNIDPADVFVSGTSYEFDTYEATASTTNVFKVVATENGVDSISNPTVSISPNVIGIWIVVREKGILLPIWGENSINSSLGETGTTFELLNRPTPVRIIDSIRGLEGSVSGVLVEFGGITAEEQYNRVMRIKSLPLNTPVRMAWRRFNIPVILGEVSIEPTSAAEEEWTFSANFWQSGEFDVT